MPGILPHHAGWFRRVDFHSTEGVDAKPRLAKANALTHFVNARSGMALGDRAGTRNSAQIIKRLWRGRLARECGSYYPPQADEVLTPDIAIPY